MGNALEAIKRKGRKNTMENRIYDEKNGLWYAKQGEYYLPELALPPEEEKPIGIWGQRHLQYLKEHKKLVYLNLLTSCGERIYLFISDKWHFCGMWECCLVKQKQFGELKNLIIFCILRKRN